VKLPSQFHADENVTSVPVKPSSAKGYGCIENSDRKHYLIDFFRMNYIWAVFSRAPWYFCICSLLALVVDLILRNNCKYLMRMFARQVLNKAGIIGQYIDMLTYSQAAMCSGKLHY